MKKLTVFVDKTLQEEISRSNSLWSPAYRSAWGWLGRLIAAGTDRHSDPVVVENCRNNSHLAMEKWLCPCCASGGLVGRVFREAQRIEACLTLRDGDGLVLNVCGFLKGERKAFYEFSFYFHTDGQFSHTIDRHL